MGITKKITLLTFASTLAFASGLFLRSEAGLIRLPAAVANEQTPEQPQRVFPQGLGFGLVPPPDMQLSQRFPGFEDEARETAIMMTELPPDLFPSLEKNLREPEQEPEGFKLISREAWPVNGGKGVLVVASQLHEGETIYKWVLLRGTPASVAVVTFQISSDARDHYTDDVVRATLRSVGDRDHAQIVADVQTLPFVIDETLDDATAEDRTGFRIARVIPGNSAMLTDGPKDLVQGAEQPIVLVGGGKAAILGRLEQDRFARQAFSSLSGVRGMQVRRAEGVTRDGVDWHEIEGEGQDAASGVKVRVTQAVRFDRSDFIRFLLVARDNAYDDAARFLDRLRDTVAIRTDAAKDETPTADKPSSEGG